MRPIQASINLEALSHNLGVAKSHAPESKIMSVLKANAYGHGLLNAAEALKSTDMFAVLRFEEAAALRKNGFNHPILLLEGVFQTSQLAMVSQLDITVVVHTEQQVAMLEQIGLPNKLTVFVKMNTGMNRLGFSPQEYREIIGRLEKCANVKKIVMMTHFAMASEASGVDQPLSIFKEYTKGLGHECSLANSAAVLLHPKTHADYVRPGVMLYGASPSDSRSAASFGLKPAMQFTSKIISIQNLKSGDSAGYGYIFTAQKDTRLGIVACGYADGYPRHAPNGTPIAVAGKMTQTLGRVSMDMMFADITDIPEARLGSEVELWGGQVPVDDVAQACGTIGYELLCAVAARVDMVTVPKISHEDHHNG